MTLVRKIIIVLVGLSLALLVTVLFLNPASIMSLAGNLNTTSALIRLPLAILLDVIVLAIIVVLVRNERSPHPIDGLTVKAQGAIADVSIESARDRILRAVRAVPDVVSAQVEVKAMRGKADVDLDVLVSRDSINVPDKQKEIDRALRQVINKQLGLQMAGKPRVHIRMDDESTLPPALEAPVVTTAIAEPARSETVLVQESAPEIRLETPVPHTDTLSLRAEPDDLPKPDSSESSASNN
ncbi:MAG: hypothetical protein ABI835_08760 [Chloroflexota bacterium]